jgi:hypothetical protein
VRAEELGVFEMHLAFSRSAQTAQVAINIIVDALQDWPHGGGLSVDEVRSQIASVIDTDKSEAVQDVISEYRRENDE